MTGNPYAGFFYIMTAVHAVHVLGGIASLGYIILRTWNTALSEREVEKRKNDAVSVGWYWHTMDGLWLILLSLLAFYK
jgi:cytochrome c oxidase subunit 3